ncbi:hypothetical protein [Streptomyces sp. KL116D]|uniref:hypothetical protein n=1 Tax=Streptomyces sp. KL116D TaxID=3045152 RepID=UPI00355923D9
MGYADDTVGYADAARHYAWWAGHPSVGPERVAAESDAVLAAPGLVPSTTPPVDGRTSASVELARSGRARRRRARLERLGAGAAGRRPPGWR